MGTLFVAGCFTAKSLLPAKDTMIGSKNNDGIFIQAGGFKLCPQIFNQTIDTPVTASISRISRSRSSSGVST